MKKDFLKSMRFILDNVRAVSENAMKETIKKYGKKDPNTQNLYIPSGDLTTDTIYIIGDFEPEWNEELENEVIKVCEVGSINLDNNEDVYIGTDLGNFYVEELEFTDLIRLVEYMSYLNETEE